MDRTIRIIFSLALCVGVYTETGIFTAISIFLIFLGLEGAGNILKTLKK